MAIGCSGLKNFIFFGAFLLIFLTLPVSAKDIQVEDWQGSSLDKLRAVANDNSPPKRLMPSHSLPPLPDSNVGTIRRIHLPDERKIVALTFDLCELATSTSGCDMEILNFLRSEKIAATLFMGGKWMRSHASRVRQIMKRTDIFEIGNHAWTHGNFALLDSVAMREQVLWTQAQYELLRESLLCTLNGDIKSNAKDEDTILQLPPVPRLFRLPYGRCTPKALKSLAEMGLMVIQWDVVTESGVDNRQPEVAKREATKVAGMVRPGSILLFHANLVPKGSVLLLREVVANLKSRGYSFVKVSKLLEMGKPESTMDGYFSKPGDNLRYDGQFGYDGTGRRKP